MSSIIIVLPKLEDAKHIKDILARRGLTAAALCTTASMALSQVHQLDSGVVICSYRIRDMHYTQLAEYLPENSGFGLSILYHREIMPGDEVTVHWQDTDGARLFQGTVGDEECFRLSYSAAVSPA